MSNPNPASAASQSTAEPTAESLRTGLKELWGQLAARSDTEHEAALLRVALLLVMLGALALSGLGWHDGYPRPILLLSAAALAFGIGYFLHVVQRTEVVPARRVLGIVLDQAFCATGLAVLGEYGTPLAAMLVLSAVGGALRYGYWYGIVAGGAATCALTNLVLFDSYWQTTGWMGLAWILAAAFIPPYVSVLARRIEHRGQHYRRRARKLAQVAMRDPLTKLGNRAFFVRLLERTMERAKRSLDPAESFAVLYCDLDGFKAVNDTHGHLVGDLLLKQVATTLRVCVRHSDAVSRLGGDEFAVMLRGIGDPNIARRIGEDIVARVKAINQVDGRPIRLSCSVGITMARIPLDEHETIESVLARSDEAMYHAKRAGKNQCYFHWTA